MVPPLTVNKTRAIWLVLALVTILLALLFASFGKAEGLDTEKQNIIVGKSKGSVIFSGVFGAWSFYLCWLVYLGLYRRWWEPLVIPRIIKYFMDTLFIFIWIWLSSHMNEIFVFLFWYCVCLHLITLANLCACNENMSIFDSLLALVIERVMHNYDHHLIFPLMLFVSALFHGFKHYSDKRLIEMINNPPPEVLDE